MKTKINELIEEIMTAENKTTGKAKMEVYESVNEKIKKIIRDKKLNMNK
ncbi:MAG: hypothetical protein N4A47_01415 [Clostridia bacterium]|jgi:hypothetical protein|nr:hypothetical protein [Clostridia bacterium]